jgi:nicotinate-nucleotide adenylyltransferase
MRRIGIYSGTFDPFHKGHLAFCLETLRQCGLEKVYVLPEQYPRQKNNVSNITKRVKTIRRMTREYSSIDVIELPQKQFTVKGTLPALWELFPGAYLTLLVGSDIIDDMIYWPDIDRLFTDVSFAVGVRGRNTKADVERMIQRLKKSTDIQFRYECVTTSQPFVTSSRIKHLGKAARRLAVDFSV